MSTPFSDTWLEERIAATANLIEQYEAAILALSSGAVLSYTIDTGQTRQTVTKQQLNIVRATLDELEQRLAGYYARRYGGGTHMVPGY